MKSYLLNITVMLCLLISSNLSFANPDLTDRQTETLQTQTVEVERLNSFWRYLISSRKSDKVENRREDLSAYSTTAQGDARWLGIGATAVNSTNWGGYSNDLGSFGTVALNVLGQQSGGVVKPFNAAAIQTFLGLGSAAYYNAGVSGAASTIPAIDASGDIYILRDVYSRSSGAWGRLARINELGSAAYQDDASNLKVSAHPSAPSNGTFAIGSSGGRNFIQSHASQPLDINPLGNPVYMNGNAIGSNAFTSTAYLPLTGGRITGILNLGDPGASHGFINSNDGLFFNADADNNGSDAFFIFGKGRTSGSGGTNWYTINSSGNNTWTGSGTFGGALTAPSGIFNTNNGLVVGLNGRAIIRQTANGDAEIGGAVGGYFGLLANGVEYARLSDQTGFSTILPFTGTSATFSGNIGIAANTLDPDAKLTVGGKIHSREVKVTVSAGADFVFEKEYNLKPLTEVAEYILINKHLPEIASAEEMKKNGLELGEMNIKLLQKIEELTLYLIEKDRQVSDLQNRLVKLENKK